MYLTFFGGYKTPSGFYKGAVRYVSKLVLQEDPEADLMAFLSYETLPSRVAWSRISRAEYEYVKNVFARRGVPINSDTNKADIIKFKDDLLGCHLYGI